MDQNKYNDILAKNIMQENLWFWKVHSHISTTMPATEPSVLLYT